MRGHGSGLRRAKLSRVCCAELVLFVSKFWCTYGGSGSTVERIEAPLMVSTSSVAARVPSGLAASRCRRRLDTTYAIPVSLASATLAGLPPHIGIYGYLLGGLGYVLFGTAKLLAIGPTS